MEHGSEGMTVIDFQPPSASWGRVKSVVVCSPNPAWRWWKFWQPRMRTQVFPQPPPEPGSVVFEGGPWDGREVVLSPEVQAVAVFVNEDDPDSRVHYRSSGRIDVDGVPIWSVFG